jgi:putative ABC transport system permease protein
VGNLWQDLRHASRLLYRRLGLSAAIVVTVGLGVGGSATIFSALEGVLLKPLPYRDPDRLVTLRESNPRQAIGPTGASARSLIDWRELSHSFDGLAAYRPWGYILTGEGEPERVLGARVSANPSERIRRGARSWASSRPCAPRAWRPGRRRSSTSPIPGSEPWPAAGG